MAVALPHTPSLSHFLFSSISLYGRNLVCLPLLHLESSKWLSSCSSANTFLLLSILSSLVHMIPSHNCTPTQQTLSNLPPVKSSFGQGAFNRFCREFTNVTPSVCGVDLLRVITVKIGLHYDHPLTIDF